MKQILLILFITLSFFGFSQEQSIEWSELERAKGRLVYLLPSQPEEFYALRWAGGRLFGSYRASRHENLELKDDGKIRMYADQSIAHFEGARVIGGKFVVFLSDKRDGENHFYMQRYGKDLVPEDDAVHLASYSLENRGIKGWFDIRMSSNEKYFAVVWEIPGRREERDRYGFKIFDQDFNEINDGEYPLPFDPRFSKIHEHHISNNGEYFLAVTEYEQSDRVGLFSDYLDYKALHIYHIAEDGLQDFELDFQGKRIAAMAMSSGEDGIFTITGIYGERGTKGVSGVFHQKINVSDGEVISEGFLEFDEEFIVEDWSDRQKRRAERRQERGKGDPQLYNYIMREATILPDGSTVGTMEQYFVQISSTSSGQMGQQSSTYYYYYNDIIAYKINPQGEFEWVKKVRKYQVSTNDGGPFSSYESYVDEGKMYFIFNDNIKNYDQDGNFLDEEQLYTANYGKKKNVVALAEIDLDSGEQSRSTLFDRDEINALAVPKLFDVNYKTGEVLLYAIWGRKERIGLLKLHH